MSSSSFTGPIVVQTNVGEFHEVIVPTKLADGSMRTMREKFPLRHQNDFVEKAIQARTNGTLETASWKDGEVELRPEDGAQFLVGRFFSIAIDPVYFPPISGDEPADGRFAAVQWNLGTEPGAAVLPIDQDGKIVLLKNFRHASRDFKCPGQAKAGWRIELPRGGRKSEESLEDCARREAKEEAGLDEITRVVSLGLVEPDSGILASRVGLFLIEGSFDSKNIKRDVSESELELVRMTAKEVENAIDNGEIIDSFTEVALSRALRRGLIS